MMRDPYRVGDPNLVPAPICAPLTDDDRKWAKKFAKVRMDCKPPGAIANNPSLTGERDIVFHAIGLVGERGYWMITGLEPNTEAMPLGDFIDFPEVGGEIKTPRWKWDDVELKVPIYREWSRQEKRPEYYILARTNTSLRFVQLLGQITFDDFDRLKYPRLHIHEDKGFPNFCVMWQHLEPIQPYICAEMISNIASRKGMNSLEQRRYIKKARKLEESGDFNGSMDMLLAIQEDVLYDGNWYTSLPVDQRRSQWEITYEEKKKMWREECIDWAREHGFDTSVF